MVLADRKFLFFSIIAGHSREIVRATTRNIIYIDHMEITSINEPHWNISHSLREKITFWYRFKFTQRSDFFAVDDKNETNDSGYDQKVKS